MNVIIIASWGGLPMLKVIETMSIPIWASEQNVTSKAIVTEKQYNTVTFAEALTVYDSFQKLDAPCWLDKSEPA